MVKKISRREFLKRGVNTALAAVAITTCGGLFTAEAASRRKVNKTVVGEDNFVIDLEHLKKHKTIRFRYKGKRSIMLYNDGQIRAFENICTHRGGSLWLKEGKLACRRHGALFDPITGEALREPAPKGSRLTPIELYEEDGKIYVDE